MNLPIFPIINLENRAWHGTRLAPLNCLKHPLRNDAEITFEIDRHYVKDKFMIQEELILPKIHKTRLGKPYQIRHTYGGPYKFFDTIKECIDYVKSVYGIYLNILNEPIKMAYCDPELEKWRNKSCLKTV